LNKNGKNRKIDYIEELKFDVDLMYKIMKRIKKCFSIKDLQSKEYEERLSLSRYKYKRILEELVDSYLKTDLLDLDDKMKQNFYIFFFLIISCKHELAKYVYEKTKVYYF
jgi:hypothetical protein